MSSPVLLFLLHATLSRLTLVCAPRVSSPFVALGSILLGFALTLAFVGHFFLQHLANRSEVFCGYFYSAIVFGCFSYAYLHLFLMGETARRLHILYELKTHERLTRKQLARVYGASAMLSARLQRLLTTQQLALQENRYVLQRRFLTMVSSALLGWGRLIGFSDKTLQ